jgi:hypothetical protein
VKNSYLHFPFPLSLLAQSYHTSPNNPSIKLSYFFLYAHLHLTPEKLKKAAVLSEVKTLLAVKLHDQNLPPPSEKPHRLGEASLLS